MHHIFLIGGYIIFYFYIDAVHKMLSVLWLWVYKGNSAPVTLSDRKY